MSFESPGTFSNSIPHIIQQIAKQHGGTCFFCGVPYPLDLHHVIHNRPGNYPHKADPETGLYNKTEYYIPVCPTCHEVIHRVDPNDQ